MPAIYRTSALRLACLMTCLALLAAPAWCEETEAPSPDAPKAKAAAPSAKQIDQWVKEMDDDSSAVRDAAVDKLTGGGKAVIPAVAKAAKGDSLEVTVRSISVLENLLDSKDAPTKAAAKAALEDLAKDEKHESGRQARKVLKSRQPAPPRPRFGGPGQIVIGGNVVQIGAGGGGFRMSTTQAGGVKTTDIDDNGKKIKIVEDAKSIAVTVTEPAAKGKKPKPKTYKAADAKELKKKHPEGYKLYEKYGKNAGNAMVANLQVFGGGGAGPVKVQIGQAPAPVAAIRRPRMMRRADALKLLKQAEDELAEAVKALEAAEKAQKDPAAKGKDKLDQAALLKQIKQAQENLTKAREGLDPAEMIKRLRQNMQRQRVPAGNR